jgi:hypothetical protein
MSGDISLLTFFVTVVFPEACGLGQMLKQVVTALNIIPVLESLSIPFFTQFIYDEDEFHPEKTVVKSAHVMFSER